MLYAFDRGSITLRKNVLTWSIPRFFSLPLDEICEIRTSEFTFKGCNYTLAIWPRGCMGTKDYFGVCLYTNGQSRLRDIDYRDDYIEFGIVDDCGNTHNCLIQRSESGHYRKDEYLRWAEFKERKEVFVPNGCLTMVCTILNNEHSDLTSTDDESNAGLCDSREFHLVPSMKKSCPNGDYNCPALTSRRSPMKLTVPQGYEYESISPSDFKLPFPLAVRSASCSSGSHKEGRFCKKSVATESHFCTNTAGDNLKSKGNSRPDESNPPSCSKTSENEFKHPRAQSDSKILIKDKKASDDYLVKTDGKYFPYKQSKRSSCGKQTIVDPESNAKGSKNVPSDNFDETALSDISCNSHHKGSCSVQKCAEVLESEDDSKNSSFEYLAGTTPPPSYTVVYCLKNVAEPDNHHMDGVFASCEHSELDNHHTNGGIASCEDPEVSTTDCVDSVVTNTPRIKKTICSACFNSIPQQPPECENRKYTKDELPPPMTMVHEHLHTTKFPPSVKKEVIVLVQNENHQRSEAESEIKQADSMDRHDVRQLRLGESSALTSSSTDTEKAAAKECLLKAGTQGTTKDLEKRSSLDGLKNLEIKMARILKDMKSLEKLSEDFKKTYEDGKDSDLTIEMGDDTFKVNKVVLKSRSPVFKEMLSYSEVENTNNPITIDKNLCDRKTFNDFLLYLYTAKCNISDANVFGMYRAATEYGVPDLKEECIQYMKNSVGLETICDIISVAKKHNEVELMEVATAFFVENVKVILKTDKWKLLLREDPDTANDLFMKSLGN